jgi:hypothetical protein
MIHSRTTALRAVLLVSLLLALGCGSDHASTASTLVVNSLEDSATPPAGTTTLRSAIAEAGPGEVITFSSALNGQTILLSLVGEAHSTLQGEIYSGMTFVGYQDRDYGASALSARKDLVIDASALPNGITIRWSGGDTSHARVLAVYGNLTMSNVTVVGGHSYAEAIAGGTQPYTLARGGGLAVWGTLTLRHSAIAGNKCTGDLNSSRDRGTYGGGIYANGLNLSDSVISGNSVIGYGAAGGGIYSVGGADRTTGTGNDTYLDRCVITGNRSTGEHSYGGGIFTLSGGPNNLASMYLTNCTVARNLAEDHPDIPEAGQYYDRGGGIYMGGGSLSLVSSTVVENAVTGHPATFSGSPNLGGGGVAATIGNAHTVEYVWLRNSVVVGNTLNGAAEDWFVGSILDFYSQGYNLVGYVDFSRILAPVPDWRMTSRMRWPKVGDHDGVTIAQAVDVAGARTDASVLSAGTDAGQPAVLWYPPEGMALDKIPAGQYSVTYVNAGYTGFGLPTDDFLNYVLAQVRTLYGSILGSDFGTSFGDMTGTSWYGPAETWPTNPQNANWIAFWRNLDVAIDGRLGMAGLNDDFWGTFTTGPLGSHVQMTIIRETRQFTLTSTDQLGALRPAGGLGDIGAIEK